MSFWKNTRVLVTGAGGFTGSHLTRQLSISGAKVRALVRPGSDRTNLDDVRNRIEIVEGDVTDLDGLLKTLKDVDYVFNPAAIVPVMQARENPQKTFQVNSIGAFNVAWAGIKTGVKKMLHVSTCHVYGNVKELPIKETTIPRPGDLYAASKYAAEIYLRPLIDEGAPIVISRAFAKYGPGQDSQYLIPRIITQLLKGERPKLGSPKPSRDYSHITDIVKGYMILLEKGDPGEIYHLGSERETTVEDVYRAIAGMLRVDVEPTWNDLVRPQDILRLFGDSGKARRRFGWKPLIGFKEGLLDTIEWWKKKGQFAGMTHR